MEVKTLGMKIAKFDLIIHTKLILTNLEENLLQAEIMYFCFYQKNVAFIGIMIAHSSLLVIIKLYRLEVETVVIFLTENSNLSGNFFAASLHPLSPPNHLFETFEYENCH